MTRRIGAGLLVLGVAATGLAAAGAWAPFLQFEGSSMSVSTANGICTSALGGFAESLSGRAQLDCTVVTVGYWGAMLVGIAGLGLIFIGIIRIRADHARRSAPGDQRLPYAAHPPGQSRYPQQPEPGHWQRQPPGSWEPRPPAT